MAGEAERARENAVNFEARKVDLRHTKDGYRLTLVIQPDDVPDSLFRDFIGSNYIIAMVRIDDDGEAVVRTETVSGEEVNPAMEVQSCAMLCESIDFRSWMFDEGLSLTTYEDDVTEAVRVAVGVSSRSEIATSKEALRKWIDLKRRFMESIAP